jgi:hypothetical protein
MLEEIVEAKFMKVLVLLSNIKVVCFITFQSKREYERKLADEEAQQLRSFQVKS